MQQNVERQERSPVFDNKINLKTKGEELICGPVAPLTNPAQLHLLRKLSMQQNVDRQERWWSPVFDDKINLKTRGEELICCPVTPLTNPA